MTMSTDYWVSFPEWEWRQLIETGRARQSHHPLTDRDSERIYDDDEYHEHVTGYIGEEAFGYIADLPVDKALRRGGDAKIDFRIGKLTINVKARARERYDLLVKEADLITTHHCYVHCWVDPRRRTVRFWGWIPGVEVIHYPLLPAFSPRLTFRNYVVPRQVSTKRDIKDLLALIKRAQIKVQR